MYACDLTIENVCNYISFKDNVGQAMINNA